MKRKNYKEKVILLLKDDIKEANRKLCEEGWGRDDYWDAVLQTLEKTLRKVKQL